MKARDLAVAARSRGRPVPGVVLRPRGRVHDWSLGEWHGLVPATVVAATAAWVVGALSGRAQGPGRTVLIVIGAVLTAAAAGLPLWQHRRASAARADATAAAQDARAAMRVTLDDALDPIVHLIARTSDAKGPDKARCRGEAIQLTVNTVAALTDADRVRVCFFTLQDGPPVQLHLDAFAGRAGAPDVVLAAGTAAGNAAIRALTKGQWILLDDITVQVPPFCWDHAPEYRTVLIGPVDRSGQPVGLLTLDALRPGEIANVDQALLHLLAQLLTVALAV